MVIPLKISLFFFTSLIWTVLLISSKIGNKDLTPIRALVTPNSYKWVGRFTDEAIAKTKNKTSLGLSFLLKNTIKSGDIENGVIFAGTGVGQVTKIQSAKEIIEELTEELWYTNHYLSD